MIWPEPSGEGVEAGNDTVDSETGMGPEDGELAVSWESEAWANVSTAVAGGPERAG